jgi:cell division septum initiation protein DivIVA
MTYTPVELRHVRVPRRLFGYKRSAVQQLLAEVADSFETVWRERHELADRIEAYERDLGELRQREQVLTQTLVAAEQAAAEVREQAKREAELIVAEAHSEARSITRAAQGERGRLQAESHRIGAMLRAALGIVEPNGGTGAVPGPEAAPAERPGWPDRDDTSEFELPAEAAAGLAVAPETEPPPAAPEPEAEIAPPRPELRKVSGGFDWGD